jgi:hypothetical protein
MNDAPTQIGTVRLWAHGRAIVRLENGHEVVCIAGSRVRGQVVPGTIVRLVVSGDVGRIVARIDDEPAPRVRASERRRQQVAAGEPPRGRR